MALLLCSTVTCQFPALPDGEIRPSEAKKEMKNESGSPPPLVFDYKTRFVPY